MLTLPGEGRFWDTLTRPCWHSCCCLVANLCPTLCDARDCSTPGSPVFHFLPEYITLTKIYAPNTEIRKYIKQILTDLKGDNDNNTIILGDC